MLTINQAAVPLLLGILAANCNLLLRLVAPPPLQSKGKPKRKENSGMKKRRGLSKQKNFIRRLALRLKLVRRETTQNSMTLNKTPRGREAGQQFEFFFQ